MQQLSHTSIKVYLSAVRYLHVTSGNHHHFNRQLTPRLQLVLNGVKREQATTKSTRVRHPITTDLMLQINTILSQQPHCYKNIMMWAACCLAFFGFLRVSEFTIPTQTAYDPTQHLSLCDIAVDSKQSPSLLQVKIKQSKTDPFRQGVDLFLGKTGTRICPINAIMPYLAIRGAQAGPLFTTRDGKHLTRQLFCSNLNTILQKMKLKTPHYNTHSFRIGAATSAKKAGISDVHIQMLGRWKSQAYLQYIRTPRLQLAKLSKQLVQGSAVQQLN